MPSSPECVSILSESECWQLLACVPLGRLVTSVDNQPDIFPVNFIVDGRSILFRTAQGTKLVGAVMSERVLFEADHHNTAEGWSVIVKGSARVLRTDEELELARCTDLVPWTSPEKDHFVRIRPLMVTGRRFLFQPAASQVLVSRAL
jgi:uncharacterized protein